MMNRNLLAVADPNRKRRLPFILNVGVGVSAVIVMVWATWVRVELLCAVVSLLSYNVISASSLAKRFGTPSFADDAVDSAKILAIAIMLGTTTAGEKSGHILVVTPAPMDVVLALALISGLLLVNAPLVYAYVAMRVRGNVRF